MTTIPDEVRSIIADYEARPQDTDLYFGADTIRLTSKDGMKSLRVAKWHGAADIAWDLLRNIAPRATSSP